jgi:murein DD-endopeptidase MepM/ murein hydrolase activator NlpD
MKIHQVVDKIKLARLTSVSRWTRALLSFCVFGLPLGAGLAMGYALGHQQAGGVEDEIGRSLRERQSGIDDVLKALDSSRLETLTARMAELEVRQARLDALGERVADLAQVDIDDMQATTKLPAVGGPSPAEAQPPQQSGDIYAAIDRLSQQIEDREQQLDNLEDLLAHRKIGERALFGAQPVHRGEISSYFGLRIDPLSGRRSMHEGVDFSGKAGSAILAAADGVVTFSGEKQGYGRLVEINHGDDCFTRYAHSKLVFVKPGDVVKKGQVIALMGSSGRATGSHLHFEVYKHGRAVDPFIYISQAAR